MIAPSERAHGDLAHSLLDLAAQVEAAECAIKQAIIEAAEAGDCAKVIAIVTRWEAVPATEVLGNAPESP